MQINSIGIFLNKCKDPPNFLGHHTSKTLKPGSCFREQAESQDYKKHIHLAAISL